MDRNAEIVAAYKAGHSMVDIAADWGISRQRVSQIIAGRTKMKRHYGKLRKEATEMKLKAAWAAIKKGSTVKEEAEKLGIQTQSLRASLTRYGFPVRSQWKEHGTQYRYRKGCRCEECMEAYRKMMRDRKKRGPVSHGTASAYMNYGCRCDPCRRAGAAANRAYRIRRAKREKAQATG